jgi:SagB-type dehydrogenase family enzyme
VTSPLPTAQFASLVYGPRVPLDDPAERLHEAAKLYSATAGQMMSGTRRLAGDVALQHSLERAGHRFSHLEGCVLPPARLPRIALSRALHARRSRPPAAGSTVTLAELSTLLAATNGLSSHGTRHGTRRLVPSGGALYPLEAYVLASRVRGLASGVHHFDPYANRLERLGPLQEGFEESLVEPTVAERAAALLVLTAVFWRSRVKYGLRGYRFALLEAGHALQNASLVAAGLGLDALPVGGYYDARLEALLGVDGVHEAAVHLLAVGRS